MTEAEQFGGPTRTKLDKRWVIRMGLITVVLFAFGGWGFYDASVVYPRRGRMHAEALQLEYLRTAQASGQLALASVFDPAGELATLGKREVLELSELDRVRLDWLKALAVPGLGLLKPEHTQMADPAAELERLKAQFQTRAAPPALSQYDILVQWGICALGAGLGAYVLALLLVVRSRVYRWDAGSSTLTLPGGRTLGPGDLDPEDPIDLSKWHKFIVFLRPLSGDIRPIKVDLFRHEPLEAWIKVLVKSAAGEFEFPDEAKAREEAERAAAAAAQPAEGDAAEDS